MPQAIGGPSAWHGAEMAGSRRWVRELPATAIGEIDAALAGVRRRRLSWREVDAAQFPLPGLGGLFAEIAEELENGCGMVKLRGLPVERWEADDLRRIYFALGSHVGRPVFQNRSGELMRDIRDEGAGIGERYGQIATSDGGSFLSSYARTLSNGRLRFHTDRCDVVALLCARQAQAGGTSKLCSSVAVHDAMLARRPDLLDALYRPVWRSRHGEEAATPDSVYPLPVFGVRDGRLTSHFSLTYIEAAQMVAGVPSLDAAQRAAIDMLLELAEELSFEMALEPGDIQFLNNHVVYHGRTPFTDDAASGRDRLLHRLWLTMSNSRALPEDHRVLWGEVAAGAGRGGIGQVAA